MPEFPDVEEFRQVAEQATECPLVAVQVHGEQVARDESTTHPRRFAVAMLHRALPARQVAADADERAG